MRARQKFSYIIENIFEPQEVFLFMQKYAGLTNKEMYGTFNMGMDYAIFLPEKDVTKALEIIKSNKLTGIHAGYAQKGAKQVIIKSKNITFSSESLDLR
jgi:phosphoribosylaminoimidazole (AIR) synthetase